MAKIMLRGSQRCCGREKVIYNIMYKKYIFNIYFYNIMHKIYVLKRNYIMHHLWYDGKIAAYERKTSGD